MMQHYFIAPPALAKMTNDNSEAAKSVHGGSEVSACRLEELLFSKKAGCDESSGERDITDIIREVQGRAGAGFRAVPGHVKRWRGRGGGGEGRSLMGSA